jgi:hypothetical protein
MAAPGPGDVTATRPAAGGPADPGPVQWHRHAGGPGPAVTVVAQLTPRPPAPTVRRPRRGPRSPDPGRHGQAGPSESAALPRAGQPSDSDSDVMTGASKTFAMISKLDFSIMMRY